MAPSDAAALAERFAGHGRSLSPGWIYADLMLRCASDIESGGPVWSLMRGHAGPSGSVPALRLLGAVHRLVLSGRAPELAAFYPSAGGTYDGDAAWPAFLRTVEEHAATLDPELDWTVQTNEVGRASVLLGGFCAVAREFGRPLRLLEVGASAGLLLRFDAYRYLLPSGATWGPAASALTLDGFRTDVPLAPVPVGERRGCDRSPIDPASEGGRLLLMSYVWPDHVDRLARLNAALDVARDVPATVDAADAVAWTRERLAEGGDAVPVVFHSVVMQYLPSEAREEFAALMAEGEEPRAWLRFEPEEDGAFRLRLTTWPGGEERVLAEAHPHGYDVVWLTT